MLSPSAWAVTADHDHARQPYGPLREGAFTRLAAAYQLTIAAASNVGWIAQGPWRGYKCIGCSLAIGPGGRILARGPYGEAAEELVAFETQLVSRAVRGAPISRWLEQRGFQPC